MSSFCLTYLVWTVAYVVYVSLPAYIYDIPKTTYLILGLALKLLATYVRMVHLKNDTDNSSIRKKTITLDLTIFVIFMTVPTFYTDVSLEPITLLGMALIILGMFLSQK